MLDDIKFNYFYNLIKNNYIKGMYGSPLVPNKYNIMKELKGYLIPGIYFDYPSIKFDTNKTNALEYNDNFLKIKYDINILSNGINDAIDEVVDQLHNSLVERNKVLRELDIIQKDIDLLENETINPNMLEYYFTDSFNNSKFIDFSRTRNILFDPDKGKIMLDMKNANKIDFSHYLNKKANNFIITSDNSNIISQTNLPNTKFEAIFTEDKSDKWIYEIKTSNIITVTGYFVLQLDKNNIKKEVNKVSIKFTHLNDVIPESNTIFIEYKVDNEWINIPETFKIIDKMDMDFNFPTVNTTALRINFIKDEPDDRKNNTYYIGIQELGVFKSDNKYEGEFYSKALEIKPYSNEELTIYSAMVNVKQSLPANTNIDYYVAIDEQVTGRIKNIDGETVDIYSTDAYELELAPSSIIIDGNYKSHTVYKSDLKNNYYISGAAQYETWEPTWLPLVIKEDSKSNLQFFNTTNEIIDNHNLAVSGIKNLNIGSGYVNYSTGWFRNKLPNISGKILYTQTLPAVPDFQALGKEFYKIFLWEKDRPPIIDSVRLFNNIRNNQKWKWNYEEKNIVRKVVLNNKFIGSDNLYIINDLGTNAKIQVGSIKNIHLTTSDKNLIENDDYIIHYFVDHRSATSGNYNKATIDFNNYIVKSEQVEDQAGVVMNDETFIRETVRSIYIEYEVEQTEKSISTWNTFLYVNKNLQNPYIIISTKNLDNSSVISQIEIHDINNSANKRILYTSDLNKEIYLNPGLYLIRVYTDAYLDNTQTNYRSFKWDPVFIGNFTHSDGIEQYSSLRQIDVIDFFTLLYDRHAEDDTKCSIIKDQFDITYLVVQKPSKFNFPGYDTKGNFEYTTNYAGTTGVAIIHSSHYIRNHYDFDTKTYLTYTTGSSGIYTYISGGPGLDQGAYRIDGIVDPEFANKVQNYWYKNISTFGQTINIHDRNSSGYLFFESGENLESYYKISYRLINKDMKTNRILLKAILRSEDKDKTPELDKYTLIINHSENKDYEI